MRPNAEYQSALQDVLGYLNFSSGAPDTKFLRRLSDVFRGFHNSDEAAKPGADDLGQQLLEKLDL